MRQPFLPSPRWLCHTKQASESSANQLSPNPCHPRGCSCRGERQAENHHKTLGAGGGATAPRAHIFHWRKRNTSAKKYLGPKNKTIILLRDYRLCLYSFSLLAGFRPPSRKSTVSPDRIPFSGMNSGININICKSVQSTFCSSKYGLFPPYVIYVLWFCLSKKIFSSLKNNKIWIIRLQLAIGGFRTFWRRKGLLLTHVVFFGRLPSPPTTVLRPLQKMKSANPWA